MLIETEESRREKKKPSFLSKKQFDQLLRKRRKRTRIDNKRKDGIAEVFAYGFLCIPLGLFHSVFNNLKVREDETQFPDQITQWIGTYDNLAAYDVLSCVIRIFAAIGIAIALIRINQILRQLKSVGILD